MSDLPEMARWDETWHRLREWTNGQAQSERLAAQLLMAEGFEGVDPSHPLGGKDRGKDALATKDGATWIMAVYFPRGQRSFAEIERKFLDDHLGVAANGAAGMAFVTNQELRLAERERLCDAVATPVELYHLERVTAVLDRPAMHGVRAQFLGIADPNHSVADAIARSHARLEGLQTGGDTYCYVMLYDFDLQAAVAKQFVVIRKGEYPLYDLRLRIHDVELAQDILEEPWGELNTAADFRFVRWQLREVLYYGVSFFARNGAWHQDLQLRRSTAAGCWLAATRVIGTQGEVRFEHRDDGFVEEFGEPTWRS